MFLFFDVKFRNINVLFAILMFLLRFSKLLKTFHCFVLTFCSHFIFIIFQFNFVKFCLRFVFINKYSSSKRRKSCLILFNLFVLSFLFCVHLLHLTNLKKSEYKIHKIMNNTILISYHTPRHTEFMLRNP